MDKKPKLISVKRIWAFAPHNALCDLIRYRQQWFCVFRESDAHVYGKDGVIRILQSQDGSNWKPCALLEEEGIDLRDPKFSVTPKGKLMLLMGGSIYQNKKYITRQTRVAFSDDGKNWGKIIPVLKERDWLWRVEWNDGIAYGVSYCAVDEENPKSDWQVELYSSKDGIDYRLHNKLNVPGRPNETTIRFQADGTMVALVRRDRYPDNHAWIGKSAFPYHNWTWKETGHHFGGPNFLIMPNGTMWASGRIMEANPYGVFGKTVLAQMTDNLEPVLYLPSGGHDTSYPGMVYHEGILWICYYSSHEGDGKTSIYLAKVDEK